MKIAISYPPLDTIKGTPLLSQNRQFQWFHSPTYIYPMVPAYAATLLKQAGFEVCWLDGIAEKMTYQEWLDNVKKEKPDLIIIETKAPVIKRHWQIINNLKSEILNLKSVLVGDHVTALPQESFQNSKVDFVLTGGDYDFLLLNLCQNLQIPNSKFQIPDLRFKIPDSELEPGIYYRYGDKIQNTGKFQLNHDLNSLPFIDRNLTKWQLYAYQNGNYKYLPGTYTMASRDCWWRHQGGCTFCAWTVLYPQFHSQKPGKLLDEIGYLIQHYQVKEIFDDSGTFPVGDWLRQFCQGMIERGYYKKIRFGCNMRVGALSEEQYTLMGRAGLRFLLYGLESANQKTLDRLNKGIQIDRYEEEMRIAKKAGLEPHVTCMIGYPWESYEDAKKTVSFTTHLFKKGYIDSLQATIVIPYPGTQLFNECKAHHWLLTLDWDDYDMRCPVMKTEMTENQIKKLTQGLYKSFLSPQYILKKIFSIRNFDDLKFYGRAAKKLVGHLRDFN